MNGRPLTVGGLFDGVGLLAYGLHLAGLKHSWLCEVDPWRREILHKRFPGAPVFDDVRAVGAHNASPVSVIAGGFPCKGASTVGRRNGFEHPETVLWREMRRIVGELRPRYVLVENVANLLALHNGAVWGEVLGDLASLGYDTTPDGREDAGRDCALASAAPADRGCREAASNTCGGGREGIAPVNGPESAAPVSDDERPGLRVEWGRYRGAIDRWEQAVDRVAPVPLVRRVDDRSAARVDRSRVSALGDGVQVQVAELVGRHIIALETERVV